MRAILLDAFGTIVHASPSWESSRAACLEHVHAGWSGGPLALGSWLHAYERSRAEQHAKVHEDLREFDFPARFARSLELCGVPSRLAAEWGSSANDRYHGFQEALIHPYDDPLPVLRRLREEGYALGLVSNYGHTRTLRSALARLGILDAFDAIIVSADVGYLKPHRRIFDAALAALDVRPEEALMVGNDLECDVVGARKAGIRAVWSPYPRARPAPAHPAADAVVETLGDLPRVARTLA